MTLLEYFESQIREQNLSIKEVADRMGCDKSYLYAVRSGSRNIGENIFSRLCSALQLDEQRVREEYGDQIAPRGYRYNGSVNTKSADKHEKTRTKNTKIKRITKREEEDPAELLINFMHIFVCELNDNGKRVTMSIMKTLRDIEAFAINKDEHEEDNDGIDDLEV